eukprot:gene1917-1057_t
MKFTEHLLQNIEDILNNMYELPFIVEMINGSLSKQKFVHYLEQDSCYLKDYSRGWLIMASKSDSKEEINLFCDFSKSIFEEEILLHKKYIDENKTIEQSPNCLLYTSYLLRVAHERPIYESLSAYLSCFWVYEIIGKYILKKSIQNNPFKEWIDSYSSDEYSSSGVDILNLMNKYASTLNDDQKSKCIDHFVKCTYMEYLFWESAYRMDNFNFKSNINIKPICVATIAGSDSGGGAGIQADLNTFHSHNVFGTTIITALTAQNTKGVFHVEKISTESIEQQFQAIKSDIKIKAIKIGMLFDSDIILSVSKYIIDLEIPIILDPVMISTSGSKLLKDESISKLCDHLIPIATLITPNIDEAKHLLSKINESTFSIKELKTVEDVKTGAKLLSENLKVKNVLIKGGHLNINDGFVYDVLYESDLNEFSIFQNEFVDNNNTHGSGCSLSASIASNMALGLNLKNSVEKSIKYIHKAISNGFKIGSSEYGTLNHF